MTHYRLYCLDPDLHIRGKWEFDAENDTAAIAVAAEKDPDTDREVWDDRRKVGVVRAGQHAPQVNT